ncbi:MAG: hypothetical protein IT324_32545 [Anaerolineae bacterium]|nr:hypothetical protein [Anaerolineae bacterium]
MDKNTLHNFVQQLLPGFIGVALGGTVPPIRMEIAQQICCFRQFVVVYRTQRIKFLLHLPPLLNVLVFADKALFPTQVNALDHLFDLGNPLEGCFILNPTAHGVFHALSESVGDHQIREDVHHLLIQIFNGNIRLRTLAISTRTGKAAIPCFITGVDIRRAHPAVFVINQSIGFICRTQRAVHSVMQDIGAHHTLRFPGVCHVCANLLALVKQVLADKALMVAGNPYFAFTAGFFAFA